MSYGLPVNPGWLTQQPGTDHSGRKKERKMERSAQDRTTGEGAVILKHTILFVGEEYDGCLIP